MVDKSLILRKLTELEEYVAQIGEFSSLWDRHSNPSKASGWFPHVQRCDCCLFITFFLLKKFHRYTRMKYYLEELIGIEVDLVIKEAVRPELREEIFRKVEYVG